MALQYLLDTNVVSELAKPVPDAAVVSAVRTSEYACAIAAPTLEELSYGCERVASDVRRAWLRRWVDALARQWPVLPFDAAAADWLGRERARLASLGRPAPRTDGEIASIAVTSGLTLVTRNSKDFVGYAGLRLADWHAAVPGKAPPQTQP